MPFKLIGMIILLVLVTVFCGFNNGPGYRCNVNLLFRTFNDVPVFLTVIASFAAGMVISLPFTFGKRRRKGEKAAKVARPGKAFRADAGAPEVKVTVRPGTLYDAVQPPAGSMPGSAATAGAPEAASSGPAASASAGAKPAGAAKSPFAAARENARAAKEKRAAAKAEKQAKKQAGKKAAESPAPHSENDVPKIGGGV